MPDHHRSHFTSTLLLCFILVLLCGCRAKYFTLEFKFPAETDTTVRLLYHAADKRSGRFMEPVVAVQGGKGTMECPAILPSVIYVLSSSGKPIIAFYAERGDKIAITSESTDPLTWKITGNKLSEQWSEWRLENLDILRGHDVKRINEAVSTFIENNPSSRLSTLLLLTTYDRRENPRGYAFLWKKLKGDALDENLISLVARADQTDSELSSEGRLKEFSLRTTYGIDTIRPGKPSILYFWHSGQMLRNDGISLLRRLARDFNDSTGRVIADICLDSDSIAWRSPLHNDSLTHTIRGWMPRGEVDSVAINLRVSRTPFFIITDAKGKIIYRGEQPAEAEIEFRKFKKK